MRNSFMSFRIKTNIFFLLGRIIERLFLGIAQVMRTLASCVTPAKFNAGPGSALALRPNQAIALH